MPLNDYLGERPPPVLLQASVAEVGPIINRDDLPATPEWEPERRDVSPTPNHAASEVQPLTWADEVELARQFDRDRGWHLTRAERLARFRAATLRMPLTWPGDQA